MIPKDKEWQSTYVNRRKESKQLNWKDISLGEDCYTIRCDTMSAFPSTIAGRIATITEYMGNQLISRERGLELLNLDPDLESEVKLQTSTLRLCEKRLCEMVEDKIYHKPTKYLNLNLALTVSIQTYNMLEADDCPDDRLELIRNWIRELTTLQTGQDPDVLKLQQAFQQQQPAKGQLTPQAGLNPTGQ
jgi:hypothetical protein